MSKAEAVYLMANTNKKKMPKTRNKAKNPKLKTNAKYPKSETNSECPNLKQMQSV